MGSSRLTSRSARTEIIPPAIDPESPKNLQLGPRLATRVLEWIGVDTKRPLIAQISRFDEWKDPLGVVEAYRLVRERCPDLQLALVGSMALDDPEGWRVYRQIQREVEADPDIHVFTNLTGVGNVEVNAFQRLADVVIQKSLREGFGLVVSEALWKGTPVVAGRAGGIPLQLEDGGSGYLVDSVEECASACARAARRIPSCGARFGEPGQARVRERFLLPRLIADELAALRVGARRRGLRTRSATPARTGPHSDPVCGMRIDVAHGRHLALGGNDYYFCSEGCEQQFAAAPDRFLRADLSRISRRSQISCDRRPCSRGRPGPHDDQVGRDPGGQTMTTTVYVPLDGSERAEAALVPAGEIATRGGRGVGPPLDPLARPRRRDGGAVPLRSCRVPRCSGPHRAHARSRAGRRHHHGRSRAGRVWCA